MKNKLVQLFGICLLLIGCKDAAHNEHEYHSVTDKIEAEGAHYKGTSLSSEKYFEHVKTIEITEGDKTFLIPERKSQIKSYACSECHNKPLDQLKSKTGKKAHWDITLKHANENTMNCTTCHNGSDMNNLKSITQMPIDLNKSYQLCNQCHTRQFDDWKGGAHGKKMGGWAPPRASLTCVNCHNPHQPHFPKKFPERYNTQYVKERN